jgi:hypothetical protein
MPCHISSAGGEATITQVEYRYKRRNELIPVLLRADVVTECAAEFHSDLIVLPINAAPNIPGSAGCTWPLLARASRMP